MVTPGLHHADEKGKKLTADHPHIIAIEGRVGRLERDVQEIKSGITTLLERPRNPGFSQVIGTLLATLATCGLIFGFAEWRLREAMAGPAVEAVEAHKLATESRIKIAVLEERANWIKALAMMPAVKGDRQP